MDQQLLGESEGGASRPDVPFPAYHFSNVPLADTALPEVCLVGLGRGGVNMSLCCCRGDSFAFRSGSGSCLVWLLDFNLVIPGIDYYISHEVSESLRVYFICGLCIGFI